MFEWLCNTVRPSKNYTQRVTQYKACTSQVKYILHITLVWCCFITTSYTELVFVSISKAAAVLIDSRSSSLALDTAVALWSFTSRGTRGKIVKEFSHLQNLDCSRHSSLSRDVWRFKTRKIKNNIANKVILGCSDLTLSRICHHQCRCPYDIAKPMLVDYKSIKSTVQNSKSCPVRESTDHCKLDDKPLQCPKRTSPRASALALERLAAFRLPGETLGVSFSWWIACVLSGID